MLTVESKLAFTVFNMLGGFIFLIWMKDFFEEPKILATYNGYELLC